jgi:hypothetical protein
MERMRKDAVNNPAKCEICTVTHFLHAEKMTASKNPS